MAAALAHAAKLTARFVRSPLPRQGGNKNILEALQALIHKIYSNCEVNISKNYLSYCLTITSTEKICILAQIP